MPTAYPKTPLQFHFGLLYWFQRAESWPPNTLTGFASILIERIEMTNKTGRAKIPIAMQVQVFFRDGWMCHYCAQPTVFAPALKYLAQFIKEAGYPYPTA